MPPCPSGELRESLVCPVLFGSATAATNGRGLRLMKAVAPTNPAGSQGDTVKRLGIKGGQPVASAQEVQTQTHGGKMTVGA